MGVPYFLAFLRTIDLVNIKFLYKMQIQDILNKKN